MVAAPKVKVLSNPTLPKTAADGGASFKIYSEIPFKTQHSILASADGDASFKRKSVTFSKRRQLGSANVSKGVYNNSKEINGKLSYPVKGNTERKALGDISNVRGSFLRSKVQDQSKFVGTSSSRSSASGTQSMISSSGKSYETHARTRTLKPAVDHSKLEKVSCSGKEACLDGLGFPDDKIPTATTKHKQTSGQNRLPPTRKSFPVRKQVHEKSTTKSAEQKGNNGFAVKPRVGRNLAPQVSYTQSRLVTVSRDKHKIDAGNVSRRSTANTIDTRTDGNRHLLPIRKSFPVLKLVDKTNTSGVKKINAGKAVEKIGYGFSVKPKISSKTASRSSYILSRPLKNHRSDGHVMPSKDKHDKDAMSLARRSISASSKSSSSGSCNVPSDVTKKVGKGKLDEPSSACVGSLIPNEKRVEQVSASSNTSVETEKEDAIRRNRRCRRSFISLVVSKLKEDLPSIYDDQNHLEVSEYVDDIYNYYWVVEAQNQTLENYLEFQPEITSQTRAVLINWLIEVHLKFDLMQETLFLMVTLLDQYLSMSQIKKNEMQLAGLTALFLASKYEDFCHPRIMDLISVSAESYTRDQMLRMESSYLKVLKFRLNAPTPYVFMIKFLKAAQCGAEGCRKFEHLAFYLIELCLVEYEALQYKPSLLCASAIYVARCTMQMTPAWTLLLCKHSKYEETQLRQCAEMILKYHKAADTNLLKVTYKKYTRPEFSKVASISPLKMLPQKGPN